MNPASLGPILLVCLGAAGLATMSMPSPGASAPAPEPRSSLSLRHLETSALPESLAAPRMVEVRRIIGNRYREVGAKQPAAQVAREALQAHYGASLTEEEEEMAYTWVWNPITEQWERICTSVSTFRVDFGPEGTVLVLTSDDMLVR